MAVCLSAFVDHNSQTAEPFKRGSGLAWKEGGNVTVEVLLSTLSLVISAICLGIAIGEKKSKK